MITKKGSTDVTTYFKLIGPTTGVPVTGLTVTDLDMSYVRDRAATVKADATELGGVDAAHGDNKMIEVDSTNCPGLYRADWPDAPFADGVDRVQLCISGAAIDPAYIEVELEDRGKKTTQSKATGLVTVYDTDGVTPLETLVRDNTNSHYIYSEVKDPVTLAETPTATTWNVAGTIMTNGSATWDTPGATLVEVGDIVEVISGTNDAPGEYVVESVDSDTQITLEDGIADGGQPSAVTYYIKQAS